MAQVTGQGTIWNLPNYSGELFSASIKKTPFLTIMGGLTGGGMQTENFQFPTASLYDFPDAAQPAITEDASAAGGDGTEYVRTQESNVTQIFQEFIDLTYVKNSNSGRLSGINTAGADNNAPNELDFQTARALEKVARDAEYTFLNGEYQLSTASNVANKTRGMYNLLSGTAGEVDASGATLTKDLMQAMFKAMADNNADFNNVILYVDSEKKQLISDIYGYEPTSRTVGGVNIQEIVTDFGNVGVVWDFFNPTGKILAAEMNVCAPVFQPVPGKGNLFREELSKSGAAEKYQLFGQMGLDHGPAFMHGAIINLG